MASILLLDDEITLRMLLVDLLEEEGHTVTHSGDGLIVYDLDVLSSIDLMITDLFMPHVDGMNAILNARKDRPDLKIIAMSGGSEFVKTDFLPHTQKFGASAILRKPFKPEEFIETVSSVLARPAYCGQLRVKTALAS